MIASIIPKPKFMLNMMKHFFQVEVYKAKLFY